MYYVVYFALGNLKRRVFKTQNVIPGEIKSKTFKNIKTCFHNAF